MIPIVTRLEKGLEEPKKKSRDIFRNRKIWENYFKKIYFCSFNIIVVNRAQFYDLQILAFRNTSLQRNKFQYDCINRETLVTHVIVGDERAK